MSDTCRAPIAALRPRGPGHQFVFYGDACSGIAGALHERTFAGVNAAVRRLAPPPAFIGAPAASWGAVLCGDPRQLGPVVRSQVGGCSSTAPCTRSPR